MGTNPILPATVKLNDGLSVFTPTSISEYIISAFDKLDEYFHPLLETANTEPEGLEPIIKTSNGNKVEVELVILQDIFVLFSIVSVPTDDEFGSIKITGVSTELKIDA